MRVLIVGIPGSGKTTQVDRLAEHLGLKTIKMGAILRKLAEEESERGRMLREVMSKGELVSDEVVSEIIKEEVGKSEYEKGFVIEGYPRTVEQIQLFDPKFEKVFYLKISIEEAKNRALGRGRFDDKADVLETRLKVQMEDLEKILEHYKPVLVVVNAEKSIDEVFEDILAHLK